ncbi:MAG: hypothetical protein ACJ762_18205 [Solirubrobacteraceae bacterium]
MTPAQQEGQRRLEALRRRAHRIRVWVAGAAIAVFLAMFATVYVQMAAGHDPALAGSPATAVISAATTDDDTGAEVESTAGADSSASSSQVAPMTTQQS